MSDKLKGKVQTQDLIQVELSAADITEAIRQYAAKNGYPQLGKAGVVAEVQIEVERSTKAPHSALLRATCSRKQARATEGASGASGIRHTPGGADPPEGDSGKAG